MAREAKKGLDYFPFDTDFFNDDKTELLSGEHGTMGIVVYLRLLSLIYRDNGYYYDWDASRLALVAQRTGAGCTTQKVDLIVRTCVKWSLFDDTLFHGRNVLTSAGIQRRYLSAIKARAKKAAAQGRHIIVDDALWLLDEKETQEGLVKVAQNGILLEEMDDSSREQPPFFSGTMHKEKKRKEEERKEKERESIRGGKNPPASPPTAAPTLCYGELSLVKMTADEYTALTAQFGVEVVKAKITHMESWMHETGKAVRSCAMTLRDWLTTDAAGSQPSAQSSPVVGKRVGAQNYTQRQYTDEEFASMMDDPDTL